MTTTYTRRDWLTHAAATTTGLAGFGLRVRPFPGRPTGTPSGRTAGPHPVPSAVRHAAQAERLDPGPLQTLALQAVDAARTAGAQYADARLTRVVTHWYTMRNPSEFVWDTEEIGLGVRVLVHGYWGFAASPFWTPDEAVRLARDAVAQATENAKGTRRLVDLGSVPVVTGTWATPVRIDPFLISVEEKLDAINTWKAYADAARLGLEKDGSGSFLTFARQERVVATSEGSLITQTSVESTGRMAMVDLNLNHGDNPNGIGNFYSDSPVVEVNGLNVAGAGWELLLDAKIPEQFPRIRDEITQIFHRGIRLATVGRYTVVCDGATTANLVDRTLGLATQLDRALGYEANAGGTSFLDDPLAMVGVFTVASPVVTVTANRSAPTQLATVQWDDEGVTPEPFTLVKDGVLVDFQTTREQAAWLAPYYQQHGRPVRSHGCAAAQDAHVITMQHMPNLALAPNPSPVRLEDLVANVQDGVLIERGTVESDFQARNGVLSGAMRQIKNGRVGGALAGGAISFNSTNLWKHVLAIGDLSTQAVVGTSQYAIDVPVDPKGQPAQMTSHSVQAVAATFANQPLINLARKA